MSFSETMPSLSYKGCRGHYYFNYRVGCYCGQALIGSHVIAFQAHTLQALEKAMYQAVDQYFEASLEKEQSLV